MSQLFDFPVSQRSSFLSTERHSSYMSSTSSVFQGQGIDSSEMRPLEQEINFHLHDIALIRKKKEILPEGKLKIHLPDYRCFQVPFNKCETIEILRSRIADIVGFDISRYYVICRNGRIEQGHTLDEYFLVPGSDLLLIQKGIKNKSILANRNYWLKKRETRHSQNTKTKKIKRNAVPSFSDL